MSGRSFSGAATEPQTSNLLRCSLASAVSRGSCTRGGSYRCLRLPYRYFGGRKLEALMWDGFTNYNVKVGK